MVKSIFLLKKARPGVTTAQAKFKKPINDCSSSRVTFFLFAIILYANLSFNFTSLSSGILITIFSESSSSPKTVIEVVGKTVFFLIYRQANIG